MLNHSKHVKLYLKHYQKIKGKAVDYKVRRSIKEGYRYDLVVEDAQADVDNIDNATYMQEG